jgi:hypothetical protein
VRIKVLSRNDSATVHFYFNIIFIREVEGKMFFPFRLVLVHLYWLGALALGQSALREMHIL